MSDPHNTQAYANEPYTREAWLDLTQRVDQTTLGQNILYFQDIFGRKFRFKKTGDVVLLEIMSLGLYVSVFRISAHLFQKLLHELNSFLKGG
ncbi:MAG: hypothetical protein CV087_08335 [Candidatus Brocadia sp. WS118]|nr:MAG: hypothetical protein CV087_08335 [Candidatus Brocadia sp. WS118]